MTGKSAGMMTSSLTQTGALDRASSVAQTNRAVMAEVERGKQLRAELVRLLIPELRRTDLRWA